MVAQIISSIGHVFLLILFVRIWEMDVDGLGYAYMLTNFSNFLFVTIYSHCITDIKPALFWPTRDTFHGWYAYLAIGIPAMIMLIAEAWAFQVMGIFSGLISVTDQAVNTVIITLIALMFMIPVGIQSAAAALIGEQIGANQVRIAKSYFKLMSLCVFILIFAVQMLFWFGRGPIIRMFTNDPDVEELALKSTFIVVLAYVPDCIQGSI